MTSGSTFTSSPLLSPVLSLLGIPLMSMIIDYYLLNYVLANDFRYFAQRLFSALDLDNDSLLDFKDLMLGLSGIV